MKGRLVTENLEYDGGRKVTAYCPPRPAEAIIYSGDGQIIPPWGETLERDEVDLPAVMIVGIHRLDDEMERLKEYTPVFELKTFESHEKFLVEDVVKWVKSKFGLNFGPQRTATFGVSASAELALSIGVRHPDLFGMILCASPGAGYKPPSPLPANLPRTYLVAGTEEPFFLENAKRWYHALREGGVEVVMEERKGEHGGDFWKEELPKMVEWAFGRKSS